ncbi:MAG TPA: hypothetical protein VGF62_01585, partial [Rhizomicrobium sp.]
MPAAAASTSIEFESKSRIRIAPFLPLRLIETAGESSRESPAPGRSRTGSVLTQLRKARRSFTTQEEASQGKKKKAARVSGARISWQLHCRVSALIARYTSALQQNRHSARLSTPRKLQFGTH